MPWCLFCCLARPLPLHGNRPSPLVGSGLRLAMCAAGPGVPGDQHRGRGAALPEHGRPEAGAGAGVLLLAQPQPPLRPRRRAGSGRRGPLPLHRRACLVGLLACWCSGRVPESAEDSCLFNWRWCIRPACASSQAVIVHGAFPGRAAKQRMALRLDLQLKTAHIPVYLVPSFWMVMV